MSSHQHDDHDGHGHNHGDEDSLGLKDNLFKHIDRANVVALNAGSGRGPEVIKPWHERNDNSVFLLSDDDNEIILRIPFVGSVNLHRLLLKTGTTENARMKVSLYANEESLDFQDAESKPPTQTFDVAHGSLSIGEYVVMRAKFLNITSIALHFHSEDELEPIQIYFVGFLGRWSELNRAPVIAVYEAQANLADHEKIQGIDGMHSNLQ